MHTRVVSLPALVLVIILFPTSVVFSQRSAFQNDLGWSWYIGPIPAKKGMSVEQDSLVVVLKDHAKGIQVTMLCFDDLRALWDLRAVAFDNSNKRYHLNPAGGASSMGIWMRSFLLPTDQLSWGDLKFVGIEKMTKEDYQTYVIPPAMNKLKEAHVEFLNFPSIGKPYEFELTTTNGSKISSRSLRGKVVLFDFWATWCAPCMTLIPELKKAYAELNGRGLEIIGVNLDETMEKAQEAISKESLPWPNVIAPISQEPRDLWHTVAGIQAIPRLWLIDKKGVLRADPYPQIVVEEIKKLMSE